MTAREAPSVPPRTVSFRRLRRALVRKICSLSSLTFFSSERSRTELAASPLATGEASPAGGPPVGGDAEAAGAPAVVSDGLAGAAGAAGAGAAGLAAGAWALAMAGDARRNPKEH